MAETEPAVPHPKQKEQAEKKLQSREEKFGKKPNILIFLKLSEARASPLKALLACSVENEFFTL